MKCNFCGREVEDQVSECPYCHYQFKKDAQVLSANERDTFEGVTIEEDGSTKYHEEKRQEQPREERPQFGRQRREGGHEQQRQQVPPQFKVHTMGCSSGLLLTVIILAAIVGLFFFLLPTLVIFAAIGAVVVFLLRLFM